jgi:hypothetical protein
MRKTALFLCLVAAGAACADPLPTGQSVQPVFSGGTLAGSGNEMESATGQTASTDSIARGGTLAGSGN